MRVLITGATGFIGRSAVIALLHAGHDVRALVRDPARARGLLDGQAHLVTGDAMRSADVAAALVDRDVLVQAAGVYSYDRRDIARVAAETPALARSVLAAAAAAHLTRVVDIASTVFYSPDTGPITLRTRHIQAGDRTWNDPYARAKLAAEIVGEGFERDGLPRVTLHPARVIGPDDRGPGTSGASVIALLRGGLTTNAVGGWVDVRDVAAAVVAAIQAPVGTHAILSSSSADYRTVAASLDRLTARQRRRIFAPAPVVRLNARLNDLVGGRLQNLPTATMLEMVLATPDIDGSSATTALGVTYHRFDETLADAIRWWAANGVIDAKLAGTLAA